MYGLFNPENKFWNFVAKLADVCLMSFLWLIASVPIFTVGAATAAFYDFTLRQVVDQEGGIWSSFWPSFKRNFKKATLLWLLQLFGSAFLVVDLYASWKMYLSAGLPALFMLSICGCASLVFIFCTYYAYPILAHFDFPLKKVIKDSFIMSMANLHVSITLLVISLAAAAAIYFVSGLFFFWIGLAIFVSSYFLTGVFGKYTGEAPNKEALKAEKRAAKKRDKYFF